MTKADNLNLWIMNTNKIKTYAPKARRDFIAAVTRRAAAFGLTAKGTSPVREEGQLVFIEGQPYPRSVGAQRQKLAARVEQHGFDQTMEAAAYTWFNRLIAIRFMELHGYLDHSFRVLSHPAGQALPEVLGHAEHLDLPGLNRERVIELKMDGTRDEELYRDLLLPQCQALHRAMPFLFESVDDETELLLPDNLLQTDSLIRDLVDAIEEEDWQEIEIIGWLYQFYISEKKDQVIGKVVKSEDIPAATQLFTPNWIVKYMVQNSLGAQWLATYPDSPLKGLMAYYIEPAEQTDEINAQLADITPDSLNPEDLTLIDPACGSGHILVEAYELFKEIYLERGYRQRDVARLILEKNLFGLDIDDRAAQLTGFALMMKGRADDRRLLDRGVRLNVMALQESKGLNADELTRALASVVGRKCAADVTRPSAAGFGGDDLFPDTLPQMILGNLETPQASSEAAFIRPTLAALMDTFAEAKTFGSLIQVPEGLAAKLPALKHLCETDSQDLFVSNALKRLGPLVRQAELLAAQYDAVVANPPYMGSGFYCEVLKEFVNDAYKAGKADLYGAFTLRNIRLAKNSGHIGMITIPNWMFLSSFKQLRKVIFQDAPISSLVHNGRGVWGSDFGSCSFVLQRSSPHGLIGRFLRLFDKQGSVVGNEELERRFYASPRFSASNADLSNIPGGSIAYWIPFLRVFELDKVGADLFSGGKIKTHDGPKYLRFLWEISRIPERWRRIVKGGEYRKHGGNEEFVVDWSSAARAFYESNGGLYPLRFMGKEGICWSKITSATPSFRIKRASSEYDSASPTIFNDQYRCDGFYLALLNSPVALSLLKGINPTLNTQVADVLALPVCKPGKDIRARIVATEEHLIRVTIADWDAYERSWDFQSLPILTTSSDPLPTLESSYTAWIAHNRQTIAEMKRLEEENNRLFIDAYGLADELTPEVPIEQITLTVNPAYCYGKKLADNEWSVAHGFGGELEARYREDTMQELVSYAIGCMMGRYSLDALGLIYANSGNEGFDHSHYARFPADADGIIPITDTDWFDEDAAHRLVEFIAFAWDHAHLEENLSFLAANLLPKKDESSRETIRRYLSDRFFKDHLQTYKNRPIYWCFSSGKQKAFQCLVYLHRYHSGTLARMRMEYVVPLQGKMAARIESLADDIQAASSSAQAKRLQRERNKLTKQLEELRHYADQRIALDLDDGVKVNYGKFGNLLAEVKTVTGAGAD
jgi:type II restriction/modification system DNA methylase subunit YeeA